MKTPGILYRISFLVILQSLFIFAVVTFVSQENNRSQLDRLIEYRFDFISQYFQAELDQLKSDYNLDDSTPINDRILTELYKHSEKYMKGLAGLAVLSPSGSAYRKTGAAYRPSLTALAEADYEQILTDADRVVLKSEGILVGDMFLSSAGNIKTVYIPWGAENPEQILAISFMLKEIVGGNFQYNYSLILLFLVSTLITLLIINLLVRNFIRPLQSLIRGMDETKSGDFLYHIENVKNDEIGQVASSFNTMSSALWNKRKQLTESNLNLTSTLSRLTDVTGSLAESEALLSKLVENAPFAVFATDPEGNILIFSRAAMATFGVKPDEALAADFLGYFKYSPDKVFPEVGCEGDNFEEEMICNKKNGDSFPALVSRVPIWEKAGVLHAYLFIIRDISESKGFREMMFSIDRMATRGVMAGEIAHEINNYLAVILGNVELLPLFLAKGDMAKVDKKLEVLKTAVARIQSFSEGLGGDCNEEAVYVPNDLNQLIENLIAFLRPQNHYDGIKFSLDLSYKLPLVYLDTGQTQQMLINLFNNAAGALHEIPADREINVRTESAEDGKSIRIIIRDNAGGLPEDLKEVIFKDRYMGKRRGRGFGLVIIAQIVDKHNGRIEYDSVSGEGTTFTMTLPIMPETVEETSTPDTSSPEIGQVTA
ncbi:MAG: PAS domain S-box protein [FCB group bacterium]|nr:PAS domain S-box protein [FCB group bacterium]